MLTSSAYAWNYLHQGGRFDSATGLYNFRERDYSPTLGRWLQNDPLGFGGGDSNTYRYLGNDPANGTDPAGLFDPLKAWEYLKAMDPNAYEWYRNVLDGRIEGKVTHWYDFARSNYDLTKEERYGKKVVVFSVFDTLSERDAADYLRQMIQDDPQFKRWKIRQGIKDPEPQTQLVPGEGSPEAYQYQLAQDQARRQAKRDAGLSETRIILEEIFLPGGYWDQGMEILGPLALAGQGRSSQTCASGRTRRRGGEYGKVRSTTKGGEVHHMPAAKVTPYPYRKAPASWMEKRDHRKTASWGSSKAAEVHRLKQADLIKRGKLREAIQMDIDDIRSKFGNKYDANIQDMLESLGFSE
jgi:RHS repeat-associated protein